MELDHSQKQTEMMAHFVKELPHLRKTICISQTELGKRLGLSRQSISSLERGDVPLTWAVYVAAVAFFLGNINKHQFQLIFEHWEFIGKYMKAEIDDSKGESYE